MKTNALRFALIPLLALSALSLRPSALAQGTVTLSASAAHGLVHYTTDGTTIPTVPVGNPAQVGTFGELNIAVYSAAPGTPDPFTATTPSLLPSAWSESSSVLHQIAPLAGNTPTFTFTLGNIAGGAPAEVMVLGWTGNAPDWNSALANPGNNLFDWSGSALSGGALSFTAATGNPGGTPSTPAIPLTYGASGFNGLSLFFIPEPSTLALVGLGAVALILFRRCR